MYIVVCSSLSKYRNQVEVATRVISLVLGCFKSGKSSLSYWICTQLKLNNQSWNLLSNIESSEVFAQYLVSIQSISARVVTHYLLSINLVFSQYLLGIRLVFAQYLLIIHKVFTQNSKYSLGIHSIHSVFKVFTQYSLSIHSAFTNLSL